MNSLLRFPAGLFEELLAHLLPQGSETEQAAFLFTAVQKSTDHFRFDVVDVQKLSALDFESQGSDYLELADHARARLIKHAHDLNAALVEMHSHPFCLPAAFSGADLRGLAETVPHIFWRLPKRPYTAVVVAPDSFDALLWVDSPSSPQPLGGIAAGDRLLRPTNRTLTALSANRRAR